MGFLDTMLNPGTPYTGTPTVRLDAVRDQPFTDQVRTAATNVVDAMLASVRSNAVGILRNTQAGAAVEQEATSQYLSELLGSPIVLVGIIVGLYLLVRK